MPGKKLLIKQLVKQGVNKLCGGENNGAEAAWCWAALAQPRSCERRFGKTRYTAVSARIILADELGRIVRTERRAEMPGERSHAFANRLIPGVEECRRQASENRLSGIAVRIQRAHGSAFPRKRELNLWPR
jgi:hypothetical protein